MLWKLNGNTHEVLKPNDNVNIGSIYFELIFDIMLGGDIKLILQKVI